MVVLNQVIVEVFHVAQDLQRRNSGGTQTTTILPDATPSILSESLNFALSATSVASQTSATSSATSTPGTGPTSSPLLFFVALGFGVVFTNLWIIVGVKYCFRYNARNRALRNGEDPDPINLENMPTRPHRRRREKKLMTMDEVNERFPLTKYKNWVASQASEGLPTSGGVTAPPSRAGSIRNIDAMMPASPTGTKHSVNTRPGTAASGEITISPATNALGGDFDPDRKDTEVTEKRISSTVVEEDRNALEEVRTTASTVDKHPTLTSENDEDDDEDDHIHTAVPPELLTNPGDSCAICIDTLEEDDDIRGLTCGHAFHAGCLDPWLTSRRACCPLCKADYYVPKPRPDAEAADADRSGRRRAAGMNMPQSPASAWVGIRGSPRIVFAGRFGGGGAVYPGEEHGYEGRRSRRSRRQAAAAAAAVDASGAVQESSNGTTANVDAAAPRRWVPRISNPFSNMSRLTMPSLHLPGRGRQETPTEDASPAQLEAGVVR